MLDRFARLRANRPAPISRSSETATCAVTSDLRNLLAEPAELDWPDWLLRAGTRSGRVVWSAGKSPNARPVSSDRPRQNSNTRISRLGANADCIPLDSGSAAIIARRVQYAAPSPTTPPA